MANITADYAAAFISYSAGWYENGDENVRRTDTPESNLTLEFSGTTLSVFGEYNPQNSNIAYVLDGQALNTTLLPPSEDQPILVFQNLARDQPHSFTLSLTNGTFGFSRLTWFNPRASTNETSTINSLQGSPQVEAFGNWAPQPNSFNGSQFRTTNEDFAGITFNFVGTGIAVMGLTGPEDGTFNATLDNQTSVARNATFIGETHHSVLHQNDGLSNGIHTLTLTKTGGAALRVGEAHIFAPIFIPPNSINITTSTLSHSPSSTTTTIEIKTTAPLPFPATTSGLGGGAKAGIAIGAIAIIGILSLIAFIIFRRRRAVATAFEDNKVTYGRICSKCKMDITGDYRLECVEPDCPAAIDLHPECKDWNVPANHSHEVHEVPNKS